MSRMGAAKGGGEGGGDDEGGSTLVEDEEEEEEHGRDPTGPGCGLVALHASPDVAGGSTDAPPHALEPP